VGSCPEAARSQQAHLIGCTIRTRRSPPEPHRARRQTTNILRDRCSDLCSDGSGDPAILRAAPDDSAHHPAPSTSCSPESIRPDARSARFVTENHRAYNPVLLLPRHAGTARRSRLRAKIHAASAKPSHRRRLHPPPPPPNSPPRRRGQHELKFLTAAETCRPRRPRDAHAAASSSGRAQPQPKLEAKRKRRAGAMEKRPGRHLARRIREPSKSKACPRELCPAPPAPPGSVPGIVVTLFVLLDRRRGAGPTGCPAGAAHPGVVHDHWQVVPINVPSRKLRANKAPARDTHSRPCTPRAQPPARPARNPRLRLRRRIPPRPQTDPVRNPRRPPARCARIDVARIPSTHLPA